ncbi:unnamed protein product [Nippostrongylus brasiliensis]|uniref:protein-tyrosine-phosphatase n=1 Tax=Nippostrongylus brasiliensis TaxID=27835 RepID=A0A0N4Y1U0_NIPBR|nr:unnamed protein product [Nippostrongylus brasiliensis]
MSTSLAEGYEQIQRGGVKAWDETFMKMHVDSYKEVEKRELTTKIAKTLDNMERNRYIDVLPFDQNRVVLGSNPDDEESYINASPVSIEKACRNYILAQGPLENTCNDFWQMIWEQKVPAVIMLNKIMESGRRKCAVYFPTSNERVVEFDDYTIELENEEQHHNFVVRQLLLKRSGEGDNQNVLSVQPSDPPCVIHCSAGIGRSGTFIVVDGVLRMIELGIAEAEISLDKLLIDLRCQRFGLIQTSQQLMFSWHAIVDALRQKQNIKGSSSASDKAVDSDQARRVERNMKRKTTEEKDEDPSNDRVAKRREMVARMVIRSRESEAARRSLVGSIANQMGISPQAVLATGGALLLAVAVGYYAYKR